MAPRSTSLIQAYSTFHRLMLRGRNNRVGSFCTKIVHGGFVRRPDAKIGRARPSGDRAAGRHAPSRKTNFPIGPGIGWPDTNADILFFLVRCRAGDRKRVHPDLKARVASSAREAQQLGRSGILNRALASSAASYRLTCCTFASAMPSLLPEYQKRRIKFWRMPPMNRMTIVIRASTAGSQTIDQRGN
jgi:hypothetical protein